MKKIILIIACFLIARLAAGQGETKLPGTWEGKIMAGISMRVVFQFSKDSTGRLVASSESPDQGIKGMPCTIIAVSADSIRLELPSVKAVYSGRFISDSVISGKLVQGGTAIPLVVRKVAAVSVLKRPQTPLPPFAYRSEEVEYDNKSKSVHFGATITIPPGRGPFPAVLLITGSGQQNRDEEVAEHKPFAVLADYLTKKGYIVLRADDRGMGKTTGALDSATTADFAEDACASLDYLESRPETDTKKLGLIGHSEGGMIAPMVAARRKEVSFIVLLAGPGQKISRLMEGQTAAVLASRGIKQEAVTAFTRLYGTMVPAIVTAPDKTMAEKNGLDVFSRWKDSTNKGYALVTTGVYNDSTARGFVRAFVGQVYSPWFRYFMQFDPTPYLERLHCRVLALNGSKDIQVIAGANLAAIDSALKKSRSKAFEVHELAGLNHLFQACKKCTAVEYGELEETFSPAALTLIGDWLKKNVL